jgi:hypothetical protein
MGSSRKIHALLLISVILWQIGISCKPSGKKAVPSGPNDSSAGGHGEMRKTVLSREQIIKIADGAARKNGLDPEKTEVFYDEGNAEWKQVVAKPWPKLEGHDFQAVSYWHRPPIPEGGLWILVDRNTGKILAVAAPP